MKLFPTVVRLIICTVILTLLVMIFQFSHQPATQSNALSKSIAKQTIQLYEAISQKDGTIGEWNRMLRKGAHFALFFMLALFTMILCKLCRRTVKASIAITAICCVAYAIFDELHQLFIDGRGASIRDIGIDSIGVALGIVIGYVINRSWLK